MASVFKQNLIVLYPFKDIWKIRKSQVFSWCRSRRMKNRGLAHVCHYFKPVMWQFRGLTLKHLTPDMLTWCLHFPQDMDNQYSDTVMFECLQCAEGCESCEDDRPCVVSLNWVMRTAILILSCVIICCLPVVVLFTWKYGNVKVGPIRNLFTYLCLKHVTATRSLASWST
jgi:hypothetical protein